MRMRQQHWLPFHPVLPNGSAGVYLRVPHLESFSPRIRKPAPIRPERHLSGTLVRESVCARRLVKFFTSRLSPGGSNACPWKSFGTPYAWRVPGRTIRRVHVMPWATPVRRIGRSLAHYNGPGGDDSGACLLDQFRWVEELIEIWLCPRRHPGRCFRTWDYFDAGRLDSMFGGLLEERMYEQVARVAQNRVRVRTRPGFSQTDSVNPRGRSVIQLHPMRYL